MTQTDLSKQSGVDDSKISRYRSGDQVWVSTDHLEKLARAISHNPKERAELIRAHLLDEKVGPGSELIDITIGGETVLQESYLAQPSLPPALEDDIATIRQWLVKDKNVREIVEGMAGLLRSGECRTTDSPNIERLAADIEAEGVEKILREGKSNAGSGDRGPSAEARGRGAPKNQPGAKARPVPAGAKVSYRGHPKRTNKSDEDTA